MPFKALILLLTIAGLLGGCERDFRSHDAPDSRAPALNEQSATPIVQYGRVSVSVVESDAIRQLAVTRTDRNGRFRLPVSMPEKPLLVEIRAERDTRLVCGSTEGCGLYHYREAMPVPDSFRLMALLGKEASHRENHLISPETHLVVRELSRLPGLINDESLVLARHRVARQYGLSEVTASRGLDDRKAGTAWFEGQVVAGSMTPGIMQSWQRPEWRTDDVGCEVRTDCEVAAHTVETNRTFY